MSLKRTVSGPITSWSGDPDCQAAHGFLLARLQEMTPYFMGAAEALSLRRQGNLGEFIVLQAGKLGLDPQLADCQHVICANALDPISDNSSKNLDLTWMYFATDPQDDLAFIQEVKTTTSANLNYASALIEDYGKLFGIDPDFSLNSRLFVVCNKLEYESGRPDLAKRVVKLGGASAAQSTGIRIIPTVVHDIAAGNPVTKLTAVRSAIAGQGWNLNSISAWSIALSDLKVRLTRLARGQP